MIVLYDRSFFKSLEKLHDKNVRARIKTLIESLEEIESIDQFPGIKAMKGFPGFFRIRSGDYGIGFELIKKDEILLILISHRKDIYKRFPK